MPRPTPRTAVAEATMRERIARAIWDAMIWDTSFPEAGTDDLREIMATADAVLVALAEPTEAMVDAGCFTDTLRSDKPATWHDRHWMRQCWASMIAEANK